MLQDDDAGTVHVRIANPWHVASRVPLELVHQIIDDVKTDRGTLLACLPVCRSWHGYAIRRLYEPVYILDRIQLLRLVHAAQTYPAVRNLLARTRTIFVAQSQCSPRFYQSIPLMLYTYVPKVENVHFLNCFHGPTHRAFFTALSHFVTITRLLLFNFSSSFCEFLRVVHAFPQLELRLDVHNCGLRVPPSTMPPSSHYDIPIQHRVPPLKALVLSRVDFKFLEVLAKWVAVSGIHQTIRGLEITQDFHSDFLRGLAPGGTSTIPELIVQTGPSVEYLYMNSIGEGMQVRRGCFPGPPGHCALN